MWAFERSSTGESLEAIGRISLSFHGGSHVHTVSHITVSAEGCFRPPRRIGPCTW